MGRRQFLRLGHRTRPELLGGVDGNPVEANVNQSLHPVLDQAALEAAMKGKYLPAREGEIPREMWMSVPFRYPPPEKAE